MKYIFVILVSASSLLLSSCGKTDGGTADTFIPDLSANWTNTADANDAYFFIDVPNAGKASSTFNGNNNVSGVIHTFSGSYTNSKISFTFNDGPKSGQKYTGTISGTAPSSKMALVTPSGNITLQQQ